jgi:hypothetical protein
VILSGGKRRYGVACGAMAVYRAPAHMPSKAYLTLLIMIFRISSALHEHAFVEAELIAWSFEAVAVEDVYTFDYHVSSKPLDISL